MYGTGLPGGGGGVKCKELVCRGVKCKEQVCQGLKCKELVCQGGEVYSALNCPKLYKNF